MAMMRRSFLLPADVAAGLNRLAKRSGATPDLLVSAALQEFWAEPVEIDGIKYPVDLESS